MKRNTNRSNMTLVYWWTHWFWVTTIIISCSSSTAVPVTSFETISTSLKSALIQNDNSFQETVNDQQKLATSDKSVPMTLETSDTEDVFGGTEEIAAENSAKNNDWLEKPTTTTEVKPVDGSLEKNENIIPEVVASLTLTNVINSTNNSSSQNTTMLSSVTEEVAAGSIINTTTTPTTKLIKVDELPPSGEHILTVKSLNITSLDGSDNNLNDSNDTVEIVMTDDESNSTEVTEVSERKSKGLLGYSEEAKIVNNISSRSALQVSHQSHSAPTNDDLLSSEALFDTDQDNGGITMNAGIISIICVGIIGSLSAFSIMFVYVYRRRFLNKPQTLSEPDSSGYIDESSIRDNSDELYSLDNDSFLNSLEAMTIQNYWTDSVKHTKL
ncbi:CLUMA_CG003449, isoform A [Clunio marinus]|uniref:CLUMA_CG003449, isoform A n=1 Tax=Clunio marinus TaxID=568069 RepID=A0A1J1HQN2_9DIPT|nr:CLUMA_CG003449, isoform A [Clunio marinus]